MDLEEIWRNIHRERRVLAATLATLTPEQWATPSLCEGWTVRDVAAHVISNPQIRPWHLPALMGSALLHGYNGAIHRDGVRRGRQPVEQVLADFDTYDASWRHVVTTTSIEPLLDSIVHHQDIVRPLGIVHAPEPAAAAVAADRGRLLAGLLGSRSLVRAVRMEATDIDWVRGRGPTVSGPIVELLMLCTGRPSAAGVLAGDGRELVSAQA